MSQRDQATENSTQPSASMFSNPWTVYLLPLAMFLVVGSFEPLPPAADGEAKTAGSIWAFGMSTTRGCIRRRLFSPSRQ